MFEKFGEFDSFEEINELAENLFNEGDTESLKAMASENGIPGDFVEMQRRRLMEKNKLVPGRKYLHRRKIVIAGRAMEAERWIRCLKVTKSGAVFRHEYEVIELTDQEIREQIVS